MYDLHMNHPQRLKSRKPRVIIAVLTARHASRVLYSFLLILNTTVNNLSKITVSVNIT
ncbi:hypothetical protein HALO113_90181 [Halomonas sp. 113]|nr:hypothetical protein HALO156_120153 [Halomonas sp. 156]CAD5293979.1 hypothetical protein HALO113_90181 [Halomonas sp. 113]VXB81805.1 hypothetical protein HALO153_200067 [Halomonas titanicae]VXC65795.1 hypothetical protein HALO98_90182 [Halomonas titanicae]